MQSWPIPELPETEDPALAAYIAACEKYFLRQLLVYQNWPQHKFTPLGYTPEKVFQDRNA